MVEQKKRRQRVIWYFLFYWRFKREIEESGQKGKNQNDSRWGERESGAKKERDKGGWSEIECRAASGREKDCGRVYGTVVCVRERDGDGQVTIGGGVCVCSVLGQREIDIGRVGEKGEWGLRDGS